MARRVESGEMERVRIAALALLLLATPAALAAGAVPAARKADAADVPGFRPRTDAPAVQPLDFSRFNFTLPREAPGRGGAAARTPGAISGPERSFRFTPSRSMDGRPVTVGVVARPVVASAEPAAPALRTVLGAASRPASGPSGYSVDMALGWQRFSLSGGVDRVDPGNGLALRQELDVGLSYGGRRWRTGIVASAERGPILYAPVPAPETGERFGLEATGAVNVSRTFSVTGGVRYRTAPPGSGLLEPKREEERVYLGGALAF
ncbi:hypothetical protein [Thermaurantiacus sp.]